MTKRRWLFAGWHTALWAAVALTAWLAGGEGARAACDPVLVPFADGVTATCTGTTVTQNSPNGYGTGNQTNLNVTVMPGASVTGGAANFGMSFRTATVTNFGTISGGSRGVGASAGGTAIVTNFGTISGTGAGGDGVGATFAIVSNYGTISGNDRGVDAATATVSNSGIITGGISGIVALTVNVNNSGTISGGSFFGISAVTDANVTNSGTISGGLAALDFGPNPDTLTLLPGSRIIGAILLGGGGDKLNFRGGNHNLTFDTLAGATVTSTTPFVVAGNRAVAVDPTPFAMTDRNLMDFSRAVAAAIPETDAAATGAGGAPLSFTAPASSAADVVADTFAAAIPGLSAYAGDAAVFKSPTAVYGDGTAMWARGFAGQRMQQADDVLLRTRNTFYGGMLGADWQAGSNWRFGLFAGGGETKSSLDLNYGETRSTLIFGGAFARWRSAQQFLQLAVQGGHSGNDTKRQINNNLVAGGLETATASFDGWYVSPEVHLGFHHALGAWGGATYVLTPSLRLRYLYASFDGYTESGSTANLSVGTRTVQDFEERGELKFTRTQSFGSNVAIATSLYGGVLAVQRLGDTTVDAALLGQAIPFATPGKDSVWGGYGGAGLAWRADTITVFGAAEYTALSDDSAIVSGRAGLRVAF